MATPIKLEQKKELEEEKENKINFNFTKPEIIYIKSNANFTIEEEKIFDMLTGKYGREKITYIALKLNMSERTIGRRIKGIKKKIYKIL